MLRTIIAVLLLVASINGASAQLTTTDIGVGGFGAGSGSYVGPGDLTLSTNLRFWVGFRAYSLATAGTNAVGLQRTAGTATCYSTPTQTTCPIKSLSSGAFDTASAASFCSGTTCTVARIYDQTGNNACPAAGGPCDATSGDAVYSATACNGFPGAVLTSPASILIAGFEGTTQPLTVVTVAKRTAVIGGGAYSPILVQPGTGSSAGLYFDTNANRLITYAGSISSFVSETDGTLYSIAGILAATSFIDLNGTRTSVGSIGSTGFPLGNLLIGFSIFGSWTGVLCEIGLVEAQSSNADTIALYNNQHSSYGYGNY